MQCPGEGPAPLGELDAPLVGMQPRAPAGDAPTRIRNGFATRTRHDAEQLGGRGPLPAPDAHPDGALYGHSGRVLCRFGCRRRCGGHRSVYPALPGVADSPAGAAVCSASLWMSMR